MNMAGFRAEIRSSSRRSPAGDCRDELPGRFGSLQRLSSGGASEQDKISPGLRADPSIWITSALELVKLLNHVARPRPIGRNGVSGAHFQSACGHNGNAGRSASPGRCQVPICPPRCLSSKKSLYPFCLCSESPEPPHPNTDLGKVSITRNHFRFICATES